MPIEASSFTIRCHRITTSLVVYLLSDPQASNQNAGAVGDNGCDIITFNYDDMGFSTEK